MPGRGFFVYKGVDEVAESILVRRCCRSSVPLEGYVVGVALPE